MLEGVLALRAWARRFRLTSHPLMEVAVRILNGWEEDEIAEKNGRQPPSTSGWGQDFDILANGWESLPEMTCEEIADRHAERDPQLESPPTGDTVSKAIRRTAAALQLV